ncbi:MAG: TonB family protein [Chitinophagales bacterium]
MSQYETEQEGISRDGAIGTILFHALLLLMLFIGTMSIMPAEEKEMGGMLINFGTSDAGSGEVQPMTSEPVAAMEESETAESEPSSAAEEPAQKTPDTAIDNKVQTTKDENAPALPVKERKKKKDTEKKESKKKKEAEEAAKKKAKEKEEQKKKKAAAEAQKNKPKDEPKEKVQPKTEAPKKQEVDASALFKGNKNSKSKSQGSSNDSETDLGKVMGDVDIADNSGTQSSGLGKSGVGFSLGNRRLLDIPNITDSSQETGIVVITIKVDREGNVIDAQYTTAGSTTASAALKKKAIAAAKKAKFSSEVNANPVQTGSLTFNFKVR